MEHLKMFEDYNSDYISKSNPESKTKFHVGDYVLINMSSSHAEYDKENAPFQMVKISEIVNFERYFAYFAKSYYGITYYVALSEIVRNLRPDEIEEFELKKAALKYNL